MWLVLCVESLQFWKKTSFIDLPLVFNLKLTENAEYCNNSGNRHFSTTVKFPQIRTKFITKIALFGLFEVNFWKHSLLLLRGFLKLSLLTWGVIIHNRYFPKWLFLVTSDLWNLLLYLTFIFRSGTHDSLTCVLLTRWLIRLASKLHDTFDLFMSQSVAHPIPWIDK